MNGSSTNTMSRTSTSDQKSKDFQMEILMEKLRSKTSQYKTLADTSKAVRMTMLDKRWALDSADKTVLQKCLDNLQHCIKVTSLQSLIERLECLSRQLGLKFMVGTSGVDLFISSDMFYLEILLESSGTVKDVKIHHEGKIEQQSCEELVSCISRGDFVDFTDQLEGLIAIYQLNAEKKIKCKAFSALQSLEADLLLLGQLQAFIKDPWALVHKSPIGFLQKRRGGHAMRLTYFVSPYELLDKEKGLQSLTLDVLSGTLASGNTAAKPPVGHYVTVLLEGSTAHKLQIAPIVSIAPRPMAKSGPIYAPLAVQNSWMLPACFVLRLPRPMALCSGIAQIIRSTTEVEFGGDWTNARPLLGLIAKHAFSEYSKGKNIEMDLSRGLFVTLPDQAQCYFLTECKSLSGSLISTVPFTHPSHVPALISCLRQQALFNALIASCIRPNSKQDLESMIMFEVSALSWQHISISLEHPIEENMATVEIDLSDISSPRVMIYTSSSTPSSLEALNEYVSRVLQKSHSIPITLRSLVKFWEREAATKHLNGSYSALDNSNFSLGLGGLDPGGPDIKQENGIGGQHGGNRTMYPSSVNHPHQGTYLSDMQHNLSLMATQDCSNQKIVINQVLPTSDGQPHFSIGRKKSKKRKSDDLNPWSGKKSKPAFSQVLLESSSSLSEDSSGISDIEDGNNAMNSNSSNDEEDEHVGSPNSHVGFVSDLELSGLDPNELICGGSSNDQRISGSDMENSGDGELNDIHEVEDMIRSSTYSKSSEHRKKHKSRDSSESRNKVSSTNSLLMDLADSKYMPPSVSITPINSGNVTPTNQSSSSSTSPNFSSMLCLDRRPGIEIIPITSTPPTALPSSITITPITSSQAKSMDERHRSEKKSSSSSKSSRSGSTERSKDKKKKKKREDPMGPPDKLPPKQDPLTKPVSVSIKPSDGSPISMRSASPNSLLRKFSPSPTHGRSVSITKSSSPSSMKSIGKPSGTSSHHSSPRSSPVQSSPKHLTGYSSPKSHGTSSPKHSSSSSGKPSMSTLKSAASGSPSGKNTSNYDLPKFSKVMSNKDSYGGSNTSKEKERKSAQSGMLYSSSGSSSPKLKSSSVKLKQLDLSSSPMVELQSTVNCENVITQGVDVNKSTITNQNRNRKGSLSAVIDKLKSAQYCGNESDLSVTKTSSGSNNLNKERTSSSSFNKIADSKSSSSSIKLNETKTQEYMVKPSSDGMKITINKTRTKESTSNSNASKSNFSSSPSSSSTTIKQASSPLYQNTSNNNAASLKTHTGLKPGVISGPASKKPQVLQSSKPSNSSNSSPQNPNSSSATVKNSSTAIVNANSPKTPYTKSNPNNSTNSSSSKSSSKTSSGSPKMSGVSDVSKLIRDRDRDKSRSSKSASSSSSSEKSIFSNKNTERRSSPAPSKDDVDGDRSMKLLNQHPKESNFLVEGLIKSLDTSKFQIPKLSARNSDDSTKLKSQLNEKTNFQNMSQHGDSRLNQGDATPKILDFISRQDHMNSKYSFQQLANASKWGDAITKSMPVNMSQSLTKPLLNVESTSPKLTLPPSKLMDDMQPANLSFSAVTKSQLDFQKENAKSDHKPIESQKLTNIIPSLLGKDDLNSSKLDSSMLPNKPYPTISVCSAETINQNIAKQLESAGNKNYVSSQGKIPIDEIRKTLNLSTDLSMKPPLSTGILKGGSTTTQEAAEMLLDFSSSNLKSEHKSKLTTVAERVISNMPMRRNTTSISAFPPSPSVSVHIVKSPAPSPLIIPSPHSNSPCITDDELMDEALVGSGK